MTMQHRGRCWTVTPTGNPDRPFRLRSGEIALELVRLNLGRPEELTPMIGTRQQTSRYGLFTEENGQVRPLEPR